MNTLDLNAYGVMEMTQQEMLNKNGGWIMAFVAGAILGGMLYQLIDDPEGCISAFKEGRAAGKAAAH
ncbi:hypothetical protein FACS1894155_00230 [Bacteroidia bacterium]|nr:hypothetical protein FACS1894155_00230 [Bacteroidia bacterium]